MESSATSSQVGKNLDDGSPPLGSDHWLWYKPSKEYTPTEKDFLGPAEGWYWRGLLHKPCQVRWVDLVDEHNKPWSGIQPRCWACGKWVKVK